MRRVTETCPGRSGESGAALLLALVLVALLMIVVVEFCYEMEVESSFAANQLNGIQAHIAAKSAVSSGMGLLAADLVGTGLDMRMGGDSDSYHDFWAQGVPFEPFNEGVMQCTIADEYGKLNLNALLGVNEEGALETALMLEEVLRALFAMRGTDQDPVDAILDWLDPDDDPRPNGAEMEYYTSLEIPYACRNGPMQSIEELLLIKGIDLDVFFGNPDEEQLPLTELLTVHGHPEGRINANTARRELLEAVFEVRDGAPLIARQLMEDREQAPFQSAEELVQRGYEDPPPRRDRRRERSADDDPPDLDPRRAGIFDVRSNVFRIRGDGRCGDSLVRVEAYVWRNSMAGYEGGEMFRIIDWRVLR